MAYTENDLKDIEAQIASAERQVTLGSKSVTYRSITDLEKAREIILADLRRANEPAQPSITYVYFGGRGYHDGR